MTLRDLIGEALAGVAARPSRLALTTLGTVLGIAALVATVGLGQTAAGQITDRFDAIAATRVTVEPGETEGPDGDVALTQLPWDAPERIERLAGVDSAGTFASVDVGTAPVRGVPYGTLEQTVPVAAASPGLFDALGAQLASGRFFDEGHDERADAGRRPRAVRRGAAGRQPRRLAAVDLHRRAGVHGHRDPGRGRLPVRGRRTR